MLKNSFIEINKNNLINNLNNITTKYGDYDYYFGVVKSNCYGHDYMIINTLIENGINYLAVADISEALLIRNYNKDIPILILEPIDINELDTCINNNLTLSIGDMDNYNKLSLTGKKIKFHLKIDSGMHRLGFNNKEEINTIVGNINNLELEGIFSHFSTEADEYFRKQIKNFEYLTSDIDLSKIKIVHMGNSAALIKAEKIPFCNGIRTGLSMYGFFDDNKETFNLKCKILQIKNVSKDDLISYGAKVKLNHDGKIAILPLGYSDGIPRVNVGRNVTINNKLYKIIAMCMNMTIIEIDNDVKVNDIVTFIGDKTDVSYVSKYTNLEPYEVLAMINPRIERKFI